MSSSAQTQAQPQSQAKTDVTLSADQQRAYDLYKAGKSILVTGPGGTGKSELIRQIVADAKANDKKIQVCAMTGCAADLLRCGARTIHSWAGIGMANGTVSEVTTRVYARKQKQANWKKCKILVIDEVSMMSAKLLHILDRIARKVVTPLFPFGGIQVLMFGDFYQLPPVGDKEDPDSCKFAFEYERWNEIIKETVVLKSVFRQTDPQFIKALHQVRVGRISKSSYNLLTNRVNASLTPPNGVVPTKLMPIRRQVDQINKAHMAALQSESKRFKLESYVDSGSAGQGSGGSGNVASGTATKKASATSPATIDYEHSYLMGSCLCEKDLELKVGAQVMCIANIDMDNEKPICNGSQGIITRFDGDKPVVLFANGRVATMGPHSWTSEKFPEVGIKQVPLILAWAITIHKSQGATLDYAEIDVGSNIFECGQTYVALSRVRSFEGLRLTSFDHTKIKIDSRVIEFYKDK